MPELFNVHGFGPPGGFTRPSSWPWVDHVVSGLTPATGRPVQTRFRYGSTPEGLSLAANVNSPVHYPRGTPSAVRDKPAIGLRPLVGTWFQVQCLPLQGFFPPFSRLTSSLSVVQEYLALQGGPRMFSQSFTSSDLLDRRASRPLTGLSPSMAGLSMPFNSATRSSWACPRSLAATDGVSVDFLSSRYLDVSVSWVRSVRPMHSAGSDAVWLPSNAGLPHSEILGSKPGWRLPEAYRSLQRPSSPLHA